MPQGNRKVAFGSGSEGVGPRAAPVNGALTQSASILKSIHFGP